MNHLRRVIYAGDKQKRRRLVGETALARKHPTDDTKILVQLDDLEKFSFLCYGWHEYPASDWRGLPAVDWSGVPA